MVKIKIFSHNLYANIINFFFVFIYLCTDYYIAFTNDAHKEGVIM